LKTKSSKVDSSGLRQKIAIEAATLLYFGSEKEYRQAKLKAAENFGTHILPSNLEIALELDKIAENTEGSARIERLVQMRTEALRIMVILEKYRPILIGSVWRGTIRRGSDIDIEVFHDESEEIIPRLRVDNLEITKTERMTTAENNKTETSFHIHLLSCGKYTVEIVVRNSEQRGRRRKCDTFGDEIRGLKIAQLEKILTDNPTIKFLPS
jgi:predicted nucleotidyltransferase